MPVLSDAVLCVWMVFWIYWLVSATGAKKNIASGLRQFAAVRLVLIVLAIILIRFTPHKTNIFGGSRLVNGGEAMQVMGFVLFLAGLALAIWARLQMDLIVLSATQFTPAY